MVLANTGTNATSGYVTMTPIPIVSSSNPPVVMKLMAIAPSMNPS